MTRSERLSELLDVGGQGYLVLVITLKRMNIIVLSQQPPVVLLVWFTVSYFCMLHDDVSILVQQCVRQGLIIYVNRKILRRSTVNVQRSSPVLEVVYSCRSFVIIGNT